MGEGEVKATCAYCKQEFEANSSAYNRATKQGLNVYCSKEHSGLGRRKNYTVEQRKALKAAYDKQHIKKPEIKAKRKSYNETPKGREAQKRRRQRRMPKHVEYCRQPEYKAKKVEYDRQYRAEKCFGEYAECAILIEKIETHIVQLADKHDLRVINGTYNKSIRRKRQWLRLLQNFRQLT